MPVQMIQSDVSRSNVQDVLKISAAARSPTRREAVHDSFVRVSREGVKFIVQQPPMLAQARAVKVPSYQDVSKRLKAIDQVPPGPMAQTIRGALIKKLVKDGVKIFSHLLRAMKHSDKAVRMRAADVLGRIFRGSGRSKTWKGIVCRLIVMPRLTAALKDKDAGVRKAAKKAISAINRKKPVGVIQQ